MASCCCLGSLSKHIMLYSLWQKQTRTLHERKVNTQPSTNVCLQQHNSSVSVTNRKLIRPTYSQQLLSMHMASIYVMTTLIIESFCESINWMIVMAMPGMANSAWIEAWSTIPRVSLGCLVLWVQVPKVFSSLVEKSGVVMDMDRSWTSHSSMSCHEAPSMLCPAPTHPPLTTKESTGSIQDVLGNRLSNVSPCHIPPNSAQPPQFVAQTFYTTPLNFQHNKQRESPLRFSVSRSTSRIMCQVQEKRRGMSFINLLFAFHNLMKFPGSTRLQNSIRTDLDTSWTGLP